MKNLKKYTEEHSVDMDAFFDELNQDASYREGVEDEKDKLSSAIAIFEARKAAGLSQRELAEESGIPKTTIARIELGQNTSIATLVKIARALGKRVRVSLV
jgi:DNA-binding XRE family transcriptional regulator